MSRRIHAGKGRHRIRPGRSMLANLSSSMLMLRQETGYTSGESLNSACAEMSYFFLFFFLSGSLHPLRTSQCSTISLETACVSQDCSLIEKCLLLLLLLKNVCRVVQQMQQRQEQYHAFLSLTKIHSSVTRLIYLSCTHLSSL